VARLPNGAAKATPLLFYRREWLHANSEGYRLSVIDASVG
jgi:hypothetical protein